MIVIAVLVIALVYMWMQRKTPTADLQLITPAPALLARPELGNKIKSAEKVGVIFWGQPIAQAKSQIMTVAHKSLGAEFPEFCVQLAEDGKSIAADGNNMATIFMPLARRGAARVGYLVRVDPDGMPIDKHSFTGTTTLQDKDPSSRVMVIRNPQASESANYAAASKFEWDFAANITAKPSLFP